MKRIFLIVLGVISFLLVGCSNSNIVEIREKMFIQQCNDIYINPSQYQGKIIQLEGIYDEFQTDGKISRLIYRRSPGCCGDDGMVGFLFTYSGEMPRPNDWIKVSGTIDAVNNNVIMNITQLEILELRGAEFVTN